MLLDETELKRLTSIFTDYAIFTLQSFKNKQKQREKLNQSFYVEICQLLDKNIEHIKRFYNGYKKSNSIDEYMLLATTDLANISGSFGNFIGILLTKSLSQKDLDEIEEIKLSNKPITEYILDGSFKSACVEGEILDDSSVQKIKKDINNRMYTILLHDIFN